MCSEAFLQVAGIPCPVAELRQELAGAHDRPRHDRREEGDEQQHVQKRARRLVRTAVMVDGVGKPLKGIKGQSHREQHVRYGQRVPQEARIQTAEPHQRLQPEDQEFIIFEEGQQGHMQRHVQRDDALADAGTPGKTGHQTDRAPVEHRHGEQQRHERDARQRVEKHIADEQKRPVFPVAVTQQPARDQHQQEKGRELQSDKIHLCLSGQKVQRVKGRDPRTIAETRPPCKPSDSHVFIEKDRLFPLSGAGAGTRPPAYPDSLPYASPGRRFRRTGRRGCA